MFWQTITLKTLKFNSGVHSHISVVHALTKLQSLSAETGDFTSGRKNLCIIRRHEVYYTKKFKKFLFPMWRNTRVLLVSITPASCFFFQNGAFRKREITKATPRKLSNNISVGWQWYTVKNSAFSPQLKIEYSVNQCLFGFLYHTSLPQNDAATCI
jgi:hypothetical protein